MAFYNKKPVTIEAKMLTDNNYIEVHDWVNNVDSSSIYGMAVGYINDERKKYKGLPIHTLEGTMIAQIGDWVIKGVNGEFYPCKPDIFEKTYERVSEPCQAAKGE